MSVTTFLSRSPGLLKRGPGGPVSLEHVPHSSIFSPTDLNFNSSIRGPEGSLCWVLVFSTASYLQLQLNYAPSYMIVGRTPSSYGRHKSHSFNSSTVKVIFWYSSTGSTGYLHWCISYFDSPAGSEVNIQHSYKSENTDSYMITKVKLQLVCLVGRWVII